MVHSIFTYLNRPNEYHVCSFSVSISYCILYFRTRSNFNVEFKKKKAKITRNAVDGINIPPETDQFVFRFRITRAVVHQCSSKP